MFAFANNAAGGLFAARSSDGGATWLPSNGADSVIADGGDSLVSACCDPTAAWDQYGNLFISYINNTTNSIPIALSTDGGLTFSQLTALGSAVDQPTIVTGPGAGGVNGSVWIQWNENGAMVVSGASVTGLGAVGAFSAPAVVPGMNGYTFGDIAIGSAGQVVVTNQFNDGGEGPTNILVSTDPDGLGGAGFSASVQATTTNVGSFDRLPAQNQRSIDAEVGLAYDRSGGVHNGRLYMVYTEESPDESNDFNIMVRTSNDDGATWSAATRVNDDVTTRSQFFSKIAIDQTTGEVGIVWYDARNSGNNTRVQLFASSSSDGGATWGANVQVATGQTNGTVAATGGQQLGDYLGLTFNGGVMHASWADNSNSTGDNPNGTLQELDIYTAAITTVIIPTNPPVLSAIETTPLPYAPGAAARTITSTLKLADSDSVNMTGATVQITAGFQFGDVLDFANTANISGIWDGAGTLTLSGTDTVANYQAALRAVTYASSSSSPATRTVSFQVTDGTNSSNVAMRTVGGYAQLVGTTVNVYGTPQADTITISEGASLNATVNGISTTFTPVAVTAINVYGYANDDSITVGSLALGTALTANGNDGNDTLTVAAGVTQGTTLLGGNGNDTLIGGGGNDILDGGANNDTYAFNTNSQLGADTITDSLGTDLLTFAGSTNAVAANLGQTNQQTVNSNLKLTLASATSMENINGGSGNDILIGNSLNNLLAGGVGNDNLFGLGGNDTLYGQGGNDSLDGGVGNDVYAFNTNTKLNSDTVTDSTGIDLLTFVGSTASVKVDLSLTTPQDVNGLGGNLTLTLASATSIENLTGGSGNDTLTGNTLNNLLQGNAGNDSLAGDGGSDMLYGQAGDDGLNGGAGNDVYAFNTNTPLGSDSITDSAGIDLLTFDGSTSGVNADLGSTAIQGVNRNLQLTLASAAALENLTGGSGNDTLSGNSLANTLLGGGGDDILVGADGGDTLNGGAGNDTLDGGMGNDNYVFTTNTPLGSDSVADSAGIDVLNFAASTNAVAVNIGLTTSQVVNGNLTLTLASATSMENMSGGSGNDKLIGNTLNNALLGGAGNDVLTGGAGNDTLTGGNGKNILIGGTGADTLVGGADEDLMLGGRYTLEDNRPALAALIAEWTSAISVDQRVNHFLGTQAGGANAPYYFTPSTVKEDGASDTLAGGSGKDWYLLNRMGSAVAKRDTVNDADFDSVFTEISTWL